MKESKKYISNVKLSGYKSIDNVSVDFQPDFNIFIGKNAAGKTNFLNFLDNTIRFNFSQFNNFSASFELVDEENHYYFSQKKETTLQDVYGNDDIARLLGKKNKLSSNFKAELRIEHKQNKDLIDKYLSEDEESYKVLRENLFKEYEINLSSVFLRHGILQEYPIVSNPFNIILYNQDNISEDFFDIYLNTKSRFLTTLLISILMIGEKPFFNNRLKNKDAITRFITKRKNQYKEDLSQKFFYLEELSKLLKKYSPIEEIRVDSSYTLDIDFESKVVSLRNLFLEFSIDGKWYSFNDLSDGTKRLFYIISEIFIIERVYNQNMATIVLIEEPELGVHPHQLHQLMQFLKDKSRNLQIVITTHSPQALDVLDMDELDAITIVSREKGKTFFRKLTDEKKEKAKMYMAEIDSLSSYWLNSDLED